jgi:hypothetical protein
VKIFDLLKPKSGDASALGGIAELETARRHWAFGFAGGPGRDSVWCVTF